MLHEEEKRIIRELAAQYKEIAVSSRNHRLREEWRLHNSLKQTRPLIYCCIDDGCNAVQSMFDIKCENPALRYYEMVLRGRIFHSTLNDDCVFEPFLVMNAVKKHPAAGDWGYAPIRHQVDQAYITEPFIKQIADIQNLTFVAHEIDEKKTVDALDWFEDVLGGAIEVSVDRRPHYARFGLSDLSTTMAEMMGYENMMIAMLEEPEFVHALLEYLQNAILTAIQQGNEKMDFVRTGTWWDCEGVPYCEELPDPQAQTHQGVSNQLWGQFAAQEFTVISPDMFDEFMLQYQLPIMQQYGTISYGCCENLTGKIDLLRKIPNLRRIGITPTADVASCAKQIGRDYVFALRPNPAMICVGFDRQSVYMQMENCLAAAQGTCLDIMLKDVSSIQGEPQRFTEWVKITQDIAARYFPS